MRNMAVTTPPVETKRERKTSDAYIGTLVGESTSQEFRLAVAAERMREQDIIAVDAELRRPDDETKREKIRVWAKVQRIERLNPLFPAEAGHELAATHTSPFETVLSLSREMVSAVCRVLGAESLDSKTGRLEQLRYPAQPASSAYRPMSEDVARILLGEMNPHRALDIATLANRPEVDVLVDGHDIVSRHLAILAMTGAGKSWTARRIIEQLARKHYPIVIFDPHGDYTGLGEVEGLKGKVQRYYARFPIFEESAETVMGIVESIGRPLSPTQGEHFDALFKGARRLIETDAGPSEERARWLATYLANDNIQHYGLKLDLFSLADVVDALVHAGKDQDTEVQAQLVDWCGGDGHLRLKKQQSLWFSGLPGNLRRAAKRLREMEEISKKVAGESQPLPLDRTELVGYDRISVVALAGYSSEFQALIYSVVTEKIFSAKVAGNLRLPVLFLLEEAHNFAPAHAATPAENRAITITRQIAQEGRKFRTGLMLISQRPSRVDETTLSQCNSTIIMRMVNPADQSYVRKTIESLGEDEVRMLPNLEVGEALLSGQFTRLPVLVRIKQPESMGEREEQDAFEELEQVARELHGAW